MSKHTLLMLLPALIAGCGNDTPTTASRRQEVAIVPMALCNELPAPLQGAQSQRYEGFPAFIYLAPAHPRPNDELFVVVDERYATGNPTQVAVRYTHDGWKTTDDLKAALSCGSSRGPGVFVTSLGRHGAGVVEFAVQVQNSSYGGEVWQNNGGKNYRFAVNTPPALAWVGDTHLRVQERYIAPEMAPANQPLQVYTQTYPMGAAKRVALFVLPAGSTTPTELTMSANMDQAGPNNANSQWATEIPAALLKAETEVRYWVRAEDFEGRVLWDSRAGQNYSLRPRAYALGWAGGLGSYRPVSSAYSAGYLFDQDGATAIGCWNHGVSASSYVERAVRVYVPGLSDRSYANDELRKAAASFIRAEIFTNLRHSSQNPAGDWQGVAAQFARQQGNDFVYRFLPFSFMCTGGGPAISDGDYRYKLRFSTDGGQSWSWLGSEFGRSGGENLSLRFRGKCSYFNDADDCLP